ncbi:MAG TPA: TIGR04351 family putative TOMM peptide [Pseudonocardiaceae bacterium]|jgi:putative thiazole/oxazole-modified microcin (TOMM)-like peptide|nr:TIGR04351 family putative TOMM peptide [Pseudonocardiaceae bacterium]
MADIENITEANRKNFARLVAQAWSDDALTERYHQDPRAVLAEFGIDLIDGVDAPSLPGRPDGEFSVEQLEAVAGAAASTFGTAGTATCPGACCGTYGSLVNSPEAS